MAKAKKEFIKSIHGRWYEGGDCYYYILDDSDEDVHTLICNSKEVYAYLKTKIENILSFCEVMDVGFLNELNAALTKAYLTGVYVEYRIPTGFYRYELISLNIMDKNERAQTNNNSA